MSAVPREGNHENESDSSAPWPLSPLPPGFQFLSSDEELARCLRFKIDGHPTLPLAFEFDVFRTEPWNLPGDVKKQRYFFCRIKNKEKFGDSSVPRKRVAGAYGYWKANWHRETSHYPYIEGIQEQTPFLRRRR
ncbi:NAC domain-containing protein 83-like [Rhodamnia argentea]|uniref:NAC domain-containing protein 83-like n=1 Tax=Rhodamnia argentea TaxID=178133 RepID=A0A8B8MYJ1_9MYRT|nr:NAC domain-containing protein 83-like [Rhodamnia argentea]